MNRPATSLADIDITPLLAQRPSPARDIAAEHKALNDLIGLAASDPSKLLPRLTDLAVQLCQAGTAGVSLLEPGVDPERGVFRWVAMAGVYRDYAGHTTPQEFSPCGVCLARGTAQLYRYPARLFAYLSHATPPIVEGLVIPLRSEAGPLGTIWIVSHDDARGFSSRDLEIMTSLAAFTSTALVLLRARDEADAASRAKDEFLAVVSHELRRPLTAIVGWSELLLSGRSTPATAARAIEALHTNARRQQEMIEDLLDASRALTGCLRLSERVMDLSEVVRGAIEIVADRARQKGVVLTAEIGGALPFLGDPERLHQVIANLLSNAVRFTPPSGRIVVSLGVTGRGVEISVRDTGIGIAPDMLPRIFDAFCTADGSSTRRNSGLGLGLTIARRLTALHDGTLEARSGGEGLGSQFTLRLPAVRRLAQCMPQSAAAAVTARRDDLGGVTILVVDDEPDVRDIIACVLEDAGATVIAAAGVEDALSAIAAQPVDVLVTDIVMPGQGGYDLLATLNRDRPSCKPRTTIAVTALASARERRRVLAAGFDHHVAKPVDFNRLVRLIVESAAVGAAP